MKRFSPVSLTLGFLLGVSTTAVGAGLGGSTIFSDVPTGAYFDNAVGEMYRLGVIKGYDDGRFGPDDYVTRGQVAVMMDRLRNEIKGITSSSSVSVRSRSSSSTSSSSSSSSIAGGSGPGTIKFSEDEYSVNETDGTISIDLHREGGSDGSVAVRYKLTEASATENNDYDLTTGSLQFADGIITQSFTIRINNDSRVEGPETLTLHIYDPSGGASIGKSQVTLTIIDDESGGGGSSSVDSTAGNFEFSAMKYEVREDAGEATITVERKNGTSGSASVEYSTSHGNATGNNYFSANGTLNFASGETSKSFNVTISDNDSIGGNKTINLLLKNPTGAAISGGNSALLTIVDDEITASGTGTFKLSDDEYTVDEDDGIAIISIDRTLGSDGTVSVQYSASDGTAKAPADYTSVSGTLTFAPGEVRKSFSVEIREDELNDPNETINISISNTTNGADLTTPTNANLIIE